MAAWATVRGVCFDLGGTLVRPDTHPTTGQVAQVLGISLDEARAMMESGAKRRRIAPAALARELVTVREQFEALPALERVLTAAQHRAVDPTLYDDSIPALEMVKRRGFAVFAMTNSLGSSIPAQPPAFQRLLDGLVYSADTGACKPERAAFAAVERACRLRPDQLLHVGDSLRADVAGALSAGWHAAYLHRESRGRLPQSVPRTVQRLSTLTELALLLPTSPRGMAPLAPGELETS
ncbi:HAD family hydrolase [Streptomyces sp. NPDC059396]|uniref:HAD family hydrolase n=1 Tax=Streptomyces sp. NPDC059396 TaxID=3346819 RepID=UPI00368B7E95